MEHHGSRGSPEALKSLISRGMFGRQAFHGRTNTIVVTSCATMASPYAVNHLPSDKEGSTRSVSDAETSDSSQSQSARGLYRKNSRSLSSFGRRRLIAREAGFVASKIELCLKLLQSSKRRFLWQQDRIDVAQISSEANNDSHGTMNTLSHYAGGTRVYTSGDGSFTVYNSDGKPAAKCLRHANKMQSAIYGANPVFPGTKASYREGKTKFYPWFRIRVEQDRTLSIELYETQDLLWYSKQVSRNESVFICNAADDSVAAIVHSKGQATVTIAASVDPVIMICVAILFSSLVKNSPVMAS